MDDPLDGRVDPVRKWSINVRLDSTQKPRTLLERLIQGARMFKSKPIGWITAVTLVCVAGVAIACRLKDGSGQASHANGVAQADADKAETPPAPPPLPAVPTVAPESEKPDVAPSVTPPKEMAPEKPPPRVGQIFYVGNARQIVTSQEKKEQRSKASSEAPAASTVPPPLPVETTSPPPDLSAAVAPPEPPKEASKPRLESVGVAPPPPPMIAATPVVPAIPAIEEKKAEPTSPDKKAIKYDMESIQKRLDGLKIGRPTNQAWQLRAVREQARRLHRSPPPGA